MTPCFLFIIIIIIHTTNSIIIDDDDYLYNISLNLQTKIDNLTTSKCQQYIDEINHLYLSQLQLSTSFNIISTPQTHVVNCSNHKIILKTHFQLASDQNNTNLISIFYKKSFTKLQDLFTHTLSLDYTLHITTLFLPSSTFYTTIYPDPVPSETLLINSSGTRYTKFDTNFLSIQWWQEWNAWKTLAVVAGVVIIIVLCITCCFICCQCRDFCTKSTKPKKQRVQKVSTYDTDDDMEAMQNDIENAAPRSIDNAPKFNPTDYEKVRSFSEMTTLSNSRTNHIGSSSKLFKRASKFIAKSPGVASIDEAESDTDDMSSLYDDVPPSIYQNDRRKTKFTMNVAYAPINTFVDSPLTFNDVKRANSAQTFDFKENKETEMTETTELAQMNNEQNPNEQNDEMKNGLDIQGIVDYLHPPMESVIGSLPSIPPSIPPSMPLSFDHFEAVIEGHEEENFTNDLIMKHIIHTDDEVDIDKILNQISDRDVNDGDVKSPITTTEIAELSLKTHSRSSKQSLFDVAVKNDESKHIVDIMDISNMQQIHHIDSPKSVHAEWEMSKNNNELSDDSIIRAKEKALMDEIVKRQNDGDDSDWSDDDILNVPLIEEIIGNENEWRDHKDGNNNNNNNDDDVEGDEEKMGDDNDDIYGIKEIEEIEERVNKLKQHEKYKLMKKHHQKLTHLELLALIYYTDSKSACNQIKDCNVEKKWKELYFHATNGIIKMYQVFHFQNDRQKQIKMLFHGSNLSPFDELSQQQCFLKGLTSSTTKIKFAESFATHIILILDNVYDNLYNGRLKGADIGWISKWNEREYIILPTTYCDWKEMNEMEIKKHIDGEFERIQKLCIYITNDYISNVDPFCLESDNLNNKDDDKYKPVMDWFVRDVRLLRDDTVGYFNKFIDDGYDRLEGIADMNVDDLIDIGIVKKGHIKAFMKAINNLKIMKITPSVDNKYDESITHSSQINAIHELNELNLNINHNQKNGLSLTSANAAFGMLSANNDESM